MVSVDVKHHVYLLTCETACLKAPVSIFLRHRYKKSFRFLYGYRYITACSFVEMRMLSLCLENTMAFVVSRFRNRLG